ncbi:lipopolysaccharide/colanic/teichoic acid biosynthesis glycosyltransferase [Litoreibacter ponti]|uniref:Lipopolysaccharide/colanic/teichoic acid biosynthesis glycosyltransferase n=1 Tax=Litoreibacter ponti TaxID=1510457 RepID=A0A2T6BPV0_9RHOB|nr:sugar transferase [Litoreibacter ponti]PTX58098.1 lipopolysaccharide/colanic/teichoic acid biosynthesis glycosyltransferase [Litoreibacter ponti]
MTPTKRAFDLLCVLVLGLILLPVFILVAIWIAVQDGRPILYRSERMRTPTQAFDLLKFRTMTVADADRGVSGGDKSSRVTRVGAKLRRLRLDEIPQLWNVLVGDISFVGPRPPLREYVERFPDLYAEVLKSRPGITGLASVKFHRREGALLAACNTPAETDEVYARRCVPRKAQLDLIYQRNRSICFDAILMIKTVF